MSYFNGRIGRFREFYGGSWGHMATKTVFCHILQRSRVMDVEIGLSLGYSKGKYRNIILYDTLFDLARVKDHAAKGSTLVNE